MILAYSLPRRMWDTYYGHSAYIQIAISALSSKFTPFDVLFYISMKDEYHNQLVIQ